MQAQLRQHSYCNRQQVITDTFFSDEKYLKQNKVELIIEPNEKRKVQMNCCNFLENPDFIWERTGFLLTKEDFRAIWNL